MVAENKRSDDASGMRRNEFPSSLSHAAAAFLKLASEHEHLRFDLEIPEAATAFQVIPAQVPTATAAAICGGILGRILRHGAGRRTR